MKKIMLIGALLFSSLATAQTLDTPTCDLSFTSHGLCGQIQFLQKPVIGKDSPFQILFTDSNANPVDPSPVFVDLWMNMGHHGHGSAPVTTHKVQEGVYRSDNVYFVMEGTWQIRVTIGHGTPQATTEIFTLTLR